MKTTTNTPSVPHVGAARAGDAGDDSWFVTTDPRRLALLFALVTGLALVSGAFLAMGLALRPLGVSTATSATDLRHLYTMHGLALVFLVALPAIPGVFGHAFLPRRLGLERLVLARAGLLGFHLLVTAVAVFALAAVIAPADAGWTFDVPIALSSGAGLWLCGVGVLCAVSAVLLGAANVVASVFVAGRERGVSTFSWALAIACLLAALAAVVYAGVLSILLAERAGLSDLLAARPAADVRFGAWYAFATHAALGSIVIGVLGLVSEVVEATRGEPPAADATTIGSLVALAVLAACGFGIDLPGRDASPLGAVVASALALLSGVPVAIFVARWWAQLADGTVALVTATWWAIASITCLCAAGLSAAALAVLPSATYLEHTSYATGVFHLAFAGALLAAVFAGVYHAWRDWFGVTPASGAGQFACLLFVLGTFLTFVPQLVLGWRGALARGGSDATAVDPTAGAWSAVGACVLATAFVAIGWNLLASLLAERGAARAEEGR